MIAVRGPTGTVIQFPDGTPPSTINQVMAAHHDATVNAAPRQGRNPGPADAVLNGITFNHGADAMAAGQAAKVGVENLFGQGPGYGMKLAFDANKAAKQEQMQAHAGAHPGMDFMENLAGNVVNPLTAAGGEWVAGAKGLAGALMRGAGLGGAEGGIMNGPSGVLPGAAVGAAIPGAAAVTGKVAGAAGAVANNVRRMTGHMDPEATARQRLVTALGKDAKAGVDPQDNLARWPGHSSPTLADVGGENVRSAIRDAGTQGPARQTLARYRDQVAGDLQNHAIAITNKLTPGETRTPQELASALDQTRSTNAATNYAEPYAAPVQLSDLNVIQALRDPEGSSAISRAITAARARMDYKSMADLQQLKATAAGPTGDGQVWPTTGQALDRVQMAFGNRGSQLQQSGARDIASGLFKRQGIVNGLLDNTPGLSEARADYRGLTNQIDAIEHGQKVTTAKPSELASLLSGASPEAMGAAGVGSRDSLVSALGAPGEGAIGAINRLSTNTNTGQNMALIHGPEATDAWRSGLQAESDRMGNANYMAPNMGSKTATSGQDAHAGLGHDLVSILGGLAKRAVGGTPLTDAERAAIVGPGIGELSPDLLTALLKAKQAPSLLPASAYAISPVNQQVNGGQ